MHGDCYFHFSFFFFLSVLYCLDSFRFVPDHSSNTAGANESSRHIVDFFSFVKVFNHLQSEQKYLSLLECERVKQIDTSM